MVTTAVITAADDITRTSRNFFMMCSYQPSVRKLNLTPAPASVTRALIAAMAAVPDPTRRINFMTVPSMGVVAPNERPVPSSAAGGLT
jgi:hypothetical protein